MNTTALKSFAPAVRRKLIEAVTRKLDFVLSAQTPDYVTTFASQVAALRRLAQEDRPGLIERVAYTWFNRLTALRYLDARGWHPFRARVLTPATAAETQPELLKLSRSGALPEELRRHTDPARLNHLFDGTIPSADPQGEVYRHLVLAACRFYHSLLPTLFEKLDDETELLLPDDLLTEHSVAQGFRAEITDGDCAEVELLGWLYQFYIAEKKDAVMARKTAVPSSDIPAVTQLFTPHWIVRYVVENTLGRLWLLNRPGSRLREKMEYYVKDEAESDFLRITKPEEIRLLDPAVGSGHMLTYAFDLLYAIYSEEGYAPSDISSLILRNNLHGVDICPRAAQLAALALVLKAREKSRNFFQHNKFVQPRILCLEDVRFEQGELHGYISDLALGDIFNEPMLNLLYQFEEASTLGALIQPRLDEEHISVARQTIEARDLGGQIFLHETQAKVLRALQQAEMLTQRYHVVVENPPYMGGKGMNAAVKTFLQSCYTDYKADLFAAFVVRSMTLTLRQGHLGFMTPFVWMFISSYERLRSLLLDRATITSLIQLEYSGFEGATVPICTFTLRNGTYKDYHGGYVRLSEFRGAEIQGAKAAEAIRNPSCGWFFRANAQWFKKLPGSPIAFWVSPNILRVYDNSDELSTYASPRKGLVTLKDARFIRQWFEVASANIKLDCDSGAESARSIEKWYPINKGGEFRKWYGCNGPVINWFENGRELKQFIVSRYGGGSYTKEIRSEEFYFSESVTWGKVTSSSISFRFSPKGFIMGDAGPCLFSAGRSLQLLALLNSRVAVTLINALCPTLNFPTAEIGKVPIPKTLPREEAEDIAAAAISTAKADWDNFETSWEFCDLPLLRPGLKGTTLEASWQNWKAHCDAAILRMQNLEIENNRLFITAYGLQEELSPEVPPEQITLARADKRKDMAALISYAVGCVLGRYSLEQPGLILADSGDTVARYVAKVGGPMDQLKFRPNEDGIIPVLDGEWFEDDIVARTREFLRVTFGDPALRDSVRFVEESVGKDLRKYFLTDFYKDHLQTYKKRPIYWLVQSPQKGFSVLIYLHRYTRDTMNVVLNRYLREYQVKLRSRLSHLAGVQVSNTISARDKTAARKEADKLAKTLHECEEWERETVLPLAQARIELDLDDGVRVNYPKFGGALAPVPGFAAEED